MHERRITPDINTLSSERKRSIAFAATVRQQFADQPEFAADVAQLAQTIARLKGRKNPVESDIAIATYWAFDRQRAINFEQRAKVAERKAMHDPLTEVLNFGGFMEIAGHILSAAHRAGIPATLAVVDFDDFKQVNDTFGHPTGDIALQEVAKHLNLRETDIVGRSGGDEFIVLLMGSTVEQAKASVFKRLRDEMPQAARGTMIQRMRRELPETFGNIEENDIPLISLSIGAADTTLGNLTIEELRTHADAAVYIAKARGKERTVSVSAVSPERDITYTDNHPTASPNPFTLRGRRRVHRQDPLF